MLYGLNFKSFNSNVDKHHQTLIAHTSNAYLLNNKSYYDQSKKILIDQNYTSLSLLYIKLSNILTLE